MSNHFHILMEVPMPENSIPDEELLKRLGAIHTEAFVATVAKELKEARKTENQRLVDEIHGRFTYRMHDLSEFMRTLLQHFCPRSAHATRSAISSSGNGFLGGFASADSACGSCRDGVRSGGS
jgi:hypothetical protein